MNADPRESPALHRGAENGVPKSIANGKGFPARRSHKPFEAAGLETRNDHVQLITLRCHCLHRLASRYSGRRYELLRGDDDFYAAVFGAAVRIV